jgi:hypothetical protein
MFSLIAVADLPPRHHREITNFRRTDPIWFSDQPVDRRNAKRLADHPLEHPESGHVLRLA